GDAGDLGSIPGSGRSPGGGPGNPLQYSCLGESHGQRSLAGYSPWGHKRVRHDLAIGHTCTKKIEEIIYIYIYIYIYTHICVYIYIFIYLKVLPLD
ncbi:hypothetical protein NYR05_11665, partial [Adlercreutzia mucosicola]